MNFRRGLTRLWIVLALGWVLLVEGVAMVGWYRDDRPYWTGDYQVLDHPDAALRVGPAGTQLEPSEWSAMPVCPHWVPVVGRDGPESLCRESWFEVARDWIASIAGALWQAAGFALAVPLVALVLGCSFWWVVLGFSSGSSDRRPASY